MRQSLEDLQRAIKGEMVMTEALEAMSTSLFNNQVPDMWVAVAYPSLMPLSAWVADLLNRHSFIDHWISEGIPVVFWISGFFFPQAFLTGTLQNFARKYRKPIDAISFGFHVLSDRKVESIVERPKDGIYIHGLHLEGARWDNNQKCLAESKPKELFTPFPVVSHTEHTRMIVSAVSSRVLVVCLVLTRSPSFSLFSLLSQMWLLPEEERVEPTEGIYRCPVYKILTRKGTLSTTGHSTNFVLFVELPTKDPKAKWIKAGVALFCALKY